MITKFLDKRFFGLCHLVNTFTGIVVCALGQKWLKLNCYLIFSTLFGCWFLKCLYSEYTQKPPQVFWGWLLLVWLLWVSNRQSNSKNFHKRNIAKSDKVIYILHDVITDIKSKYINFSNNSSNIAWPQIALANSNQYS